MKPAIIKVVARGSGLLDLILKIAIDVFEIKIISKQLFRLINKIYETSIVIKGQIELPFCRKELNN